MNRIHWQRTSAHANMLTYIEYIGELEQRRRALTICLEKPVIPVWIQMVSFIPMNFFFRVKGNTFRAISFFPDSTGISENFPPFVNNLMPGSPRQHFREEIQDGPKPPHRYIETLGSSGTAQSDPFPWIGMVQFHLYKKFHGNSIEMVSARWQRQRQRQKTMIWLGKWWKRIVLHVRHAL